MEWLVFLIVNLLALYASGVVACYLVPRGAGSPAFTITAAILVYFAQITVCVLFLGIVAGYLTPVSAQGSVVVVAIVLAMLFRRSRYPLIGPLLSELGSLLRLRDMTLRIMVVLLVMQLIVLTAKVVIFPPHIWDVFTYHLTPAVEWYQQQRIPLEIDTPVYRINSQTLGMSVLGFWFFIGLRHDMLVELPQLLWSLLLLPIVYALLTSEKAGREWAFKFAVVTFFVPIVIMQSVTAKDHLGLNIAFLAGLLFLYRFLQQGGYRNLIVTSVAFGLMLGYKLSAPLYILVSGIFFLLLLRASPGRRTLAAGGWKTATGTGLVSVLLMTAIGGYWYLRNLFLHGNPVGHLYNARYLEKLNAPGKPLPPLVSEAPSIAPGLHKLTVGLENFFPRVFDFQAPYGTDLVLISGFGPQFAAFGLLALLLAGGCLFIRRLRLAPVMLLVYSAVTLLLCYYLLYHTPVSYRLYSFFPLLLIPFAAVRIGDSGWFTRAPLRRMVNFVLIVSLLWNLLLLLQPRYSNPWRIREFMSLDGDYRTSAEYTNWFGSNHPSLYRLLKYIPDDEPIAYLSQPWSRYSVRAVDDTWTYPYYDRQWRRKTVYLRRESYVDCGEQRRCVPKDALGRYLRTHGISLVTVCRTNVCLALDDPAFQELATGLYYYRGGSGSE